MSKRCSKCGAMKPLALFHSNGPGRHRSACKACEHARDKERYAPRPRPPGLTREERNAKARAERAATGVLRPPKVPKPPYVPVGRYGRVPGLLELDGVSRTRAQWAAILGLAGPQSLIARIDRDWNMGRTLTQHVIFKNRAATPANAVLGKSTTLTFNDMTLTVEEWADMLSEPLNMTVPALLGRLRLGWEPHRALSTLVRPHERKVPPKIAPEFIGPKRPRGRPRNPR